MGKIEGAVGDLEAAIGLDPAQDPAIADLMDQLVEIARQVASSAIDAAITGVGDPGKIVDAQEALAEGDAASTFKDAAAKYSDAVSKAESAL